MICWLLGLSPAHIRHLREEPSLAAGLARSAQDMAMKNQRAEIFRRMSPEKRQEAEARYQAMLEQMPALKELGARNAEVRSKVEAIGPIEDALGLEKSWHMLHYLFTGHAAPFHAPGDALLTGEDMGEDVGYGPARLHSEKDTAEFARFLAAEDAAQLQRRINYREMSRIGIYGMPMGPSPETEFEEMLRAEVAAYFPLLRDYIVHMAEKGNGFLVWLS
jgi:hypothetical protein